MRHLFLVLLFVFFLCVFRVNSLSAASETDYAVTYVHPLSFGSPFIGFTSGYLISVSESLPVHFGIRADFSINLLEQKDYASDILNYDIRMPLFIGLRMSFPVSFFVPYIELGSEFSFDLDIVGSSSILGIFSYSERRFNFNFGGGFGGGVNFHIGSFILGAVFRYHLPMDMERHYFTAGVVFGSEI